MKLFDRVREFAAGEPFMILCLVLAYGSVAFDIPAVGICVMSVILAVLFVVTDDILLPMTPLVLLCALAFLCTEELWLLWLLIPLVGTLVYRFVRNLRLSRQAGNFYSLPGLVAVAVAVTLAGTFTVSVEEALQPIPLVMVLCLGVLMVPIYLFFKGGMVCRRTYNVPDKVAAIMYMLGMFLAFLILRLFIIHPELWESENVGLASSDYIWWRNGAATLMVMVLPFIFYYAIRHNPLHIFSAVFVYGAMVFSGSRGGLVCGGLMFLVSLLYFVHYQKKFGRLLWILLLLGAAMAFLFHRQIIDIGHHLLRLTFDLELLLKEDRVRFAIRSVEDFIKNPLFGVGFSYRGNYDIHELVVNWYHSLVPQIVGGMGLFGILAYGYQFVLRIRLIKKAPRDPYMDALALGYLAILVYSMIDPGLMTPYAILPTVFFVFMEEEAHPEPVRLFQKKNKTEKE